MQINEGTLGWILSALSAARHQDDAQHHLTLPYGSMRCLVGLEVLQVTTGEVLPA